MNSSLSHFYKITSENRKDFLANLLHGMTSMGFQGSILNSQGFLQKQGDQIFYEMAYLGTGGYEYEYKGAESTESIIERFSASPANYLVMYWIRFNDFDWDFNLHLSMDDLSKEAKQIKYSLALSLPSSRIFDESGYLAGYVNIFRNVCLAISPDYALADDEYTLESTLYQYEGSLTDIKVMDLYRINYFGKKLVETFGEDKIKNAPFYDVEMLSNGGALLCQPLFEQGKPRDYHKKLAEYLGIEWSGS